MPRNLLCKLNSFWEDKPNHPDTKYYATLDLAAEAMMSKLKSSSFVSNCRAIAGLSREDYTMSFNAMMCLYPLCTSELKAGFAAFDEVTQAYNVANPDLKQIPLLLDDYPGDEDGNAPGEFYKRAEASAKKFNFPGEKIIKVKSFKLKLNKPTSETQDESD